MSLTQINKAGLDEIALDHVFTIGASGSSAYTFQGEGLNGTVNNPTLYLTRGKTYRFENGSGGHPIRIQSTSGASGTAYNTGVTNNAGSGTVIVEVQHDAPDVLYYQCTSHAAMNGILYITGALADGGVTTAKLADDAVTDAKLANSINSAIAANTAKTSNATHTGDVTGSTSLTIASGAVTTAKIADEAVTLAKLPHGDGSSDGKFLRANNGADPTFETVSGTTINSNAATRVILGSASANTLNASSNLTFNGGDLSITSSDNNAGGLSVTTTNNTQGSADALVSIRGGDNAQSVLELECNGQNHQFVESGTGDLKIFDNATERMRLDSNGQLLVGTTASSAYGNRQMAVGDVSNSSSFIEIRTSNIGTGHLLFSRTAGANSGNYQGYIAYNQNLDAMSFHTGAGTQRARIDSDGLKFNADTAAANALDDYEEGTWTPQVWRSSGSSEISGVSGRYGYYCLVGKLLHLSFYVYYNSLSESSSQTWIIRNLPYNVLISHNGAYQFLPGGYYYMMGNNVGDTNNNGSYRWQANGTFSNNTLTLYSNANAMNANGSVEFSGTGTLLIG